MLRYSILLCGSPVKRLAKGLISGQAEMRTALACPPGREKELVFFPPTQARRGMSAFSLPLRLSTVGLSRISKNLAGSAEKVWFIRALLLVPDRGNTATSCPLLDGRGLNIAVLFSLPVYIERHFSRIFQLSLGHSLRRFSCAQRPWRSASSPSGLGFQRKISRTTYVRLRPSGRDFSPDPPQKARLWPWEQGASRRFAQECPE